MCVCGGGGGGGGGGGKRHGRTWPGLPLNAGSPCP